MIRRRRLTVGRSLQYLALAAYMVFLAFPLVWMLSTSLKGPREVLSFHPTLIPLQATLENYRQALTEQNLVQAAINSTQVSLVTALLTVVVAFPAAYALVRYQSVIRRFALGWILISQVFPVILIIIPLFLILKSLHLLDSLPGLDAVYLVWSLPFVLWMLQSYVSAIPLDLEEAAATDGAGRLGTLVYVVMPLLVPGLVVAALFAFISAWNEFFFALVVLQRPELSTLPLTLARFVGTEGNVRLGPLAAASLLATIPSLAFFAAFQGRLTSGLLAGGVKG
jgi:multiple sugar transport system permease protein